MGYRGTIGKTNWSKGEISPRALGRFDLEKPIWKDGAEIIENMLIGQVSSLTNRPATQFIASIKDITQKACLYRFTYSIAQEYILEVGNLYMRFFSNVNGVPGQVLSAPNTPLEIVTIFNQADIFNLQVANKSDVMYIVNSNYYPQKLIRTSATSFTIGNVPFVRGPFLDTNITATTITASADSGTNISLTASTAIFQVGHIGSLWRVKGGVVKITTYTSPTVVHGDVQAEPNGAAGALGTSGSGVTDWAEGAFSQVRGYPSSVCFHEGRLVYGGTIYQPQNIYGSTAGVYDDFASGTAQAGDAYDYEIAGNQANGIRWLASDTALELGTAGGTISAADGNPATGITPTAPPTITNDNNYGVMAQEPVMLGGFLFFIQANGFYIRQLTFDFYTNKRKAVDMMLLADHILRDGFGAVQMAAQVSPYDRIWVVRNDGQIAVFNRDPDQQVEGWTRIVGGESDLTTTCPGLAGGFESISLLPIDGQDDQIWVICNRLINGVHQRYVEIFTDELFDNYWEPVRVDCSLSYDNPINITGVSNTNPITVTAPGHGFSEFDIVRMDGIIGMSFLNGNDYQIKNVTVNTFDLYQVPS